MILLRRGRSALPAGSSVGLDVRLDLGPAIRRRQECFAPWRPPIEVFETARELVIRAEIGGLAVDELSVDIADDVLTIRGERNISRPEEHRLYHESQVRYGSFEASVRLPFPIDIPRANADYVDGFLTVNLPRRTATKVAPRNAGQEGNAERGGPRADDQF